MPGVQSSEKMSQEKSLRDPCTKKCITYPICKAHIYKDLKKRIEQELPNDNGYESKRVFSYSYNDEINEYYKTIYRITLRQVLNLYIKCTIIKKYHDYCYAVNGQYAKNLSRALSVIQSFELSQIPQVQSYIRYINFDINVYNSKLKQTEHITLDDIYLTTPKTLTI